jgi:hypothetical protein
VVERLDSENKWTAFESLQVIKTSDDRRRLKRKFFLGSEVRFRDHSTGRVFCDIPAAGIDADKEFFPVRIGCSP